MNKLSISIVFLISCLVVSATAQRSTGVTAFWTDYNVKKINWDYNAARVACATVDGGKPLKWRSKYGWTAFCGQVGPPMQAACGKCLRVTNPRTNEETIVRAVDVCGVNGLVMDRDTAFNYIDSDGYGIELGHLTVDYEFVDCDQPEDAPVPAPSPSLEVV